MATSKAKSARPPPPVARGAAAAAATVSRGGAPTTIGLLRLAALDLSVVEQRLERLATMLPEVDTIALVRKQPSLLRRDVDGSLRPRLLFLAAMLRDPAEASRVIVANPRLLMSSYGVLSRVPFVLLCVPVRPDCALIAP